MKILRIILLVGGLGLIVWGVVDYFEAAQDQTDQLVSKIILGCLAVLGSIFAKSRR